MKWLIIVAVIVFAIGGSIVPISGMMVRKGLENPTKSWAPGMTQKGARLRMFFGNYGTAAGIWQQAADTWPKHPDHPRMLYRVAFCLEKAKQPAAAIMWYGKYLEAYPGHMWRDQAERRLAQLKGGA